MLTRRSSRVRGHQAFLFILLNLCTGILVASCGPTGSGNYLANGIGSDLAASGTDIAQTTNLQNAYFKYLCQQSGIGLVTNSHAKSGCNLNPVGDEKWLLVVAQGMNDIDRRCDSYLQWLDNQKRSKGPVLSQIGSVRAATTGIMGVAEASAQALTIAGLAFDLISKSVENYHSRLLLEVESSTVNSIVLNLRRQFRDDFRNKQIKVTDRPQAEFILRSYLRLCLPFAIEANINNFSTLGSGGIAPTPENSINWSPQSGLSLGKSIPKAGAVGTVEPTETDPEDTFLTESTGLSSDEKAMAGNRTPEIIQNALCVEADGVFGPTTRSAIVAAKNGLRTSGANIPGLQSDTSDTLNTSLIDYFSQKTDSCFNHTRGYKNAFEKYAFHSDARLDTFQNLLNGCLGHIKSLATDKAAYDFDLASGGAFSRRFDTKTRQAIEAARKVLRQQKNPLDEDFTSDAVTLKLYIALSSNCRGLDQTNFQQPE